MTHKERVFITVMTYPHPSRGYQELVCTAGITEQNDWVRLYPIDYRYLPRYQRFHKYQWIEVDLDERGDGNDRRKESRRPELDSIRLIGEPISTGKNRMWEDRRKLIDAMPHHTVNQLKESYENEKTSLGIVRPSKVHDLKIKPCTEPDWKPEWKNLFLQKTLFGPKQKPLTKIPFTFHYIFECEDSYEPHTAMCEDWELGALFLNERERLGSDEAAAESTRKKFLEVLCGPNIDTRFFMGTFFPYNTWLVLGVFWPPKLSKRLF